MLSIAIEMIGRALASRRILGDIICGRELLHTTQTPKLHRKTLRFGKQGATEPRLKPTAFGDVVQYHHHEHPLLGMTV